MAKTSDEERKAKNRAYRSALRAVDPEKRKVAAAAYYAANREKKRAAEKARYAARSEEHRARDVARAAARYAANREKILARTSAYAAANRDKVSANATARRAAIRAEVLAHYGGKCLCCWECFEPHLQIDHIAGDGAAHRRSLKQHRVVQSGANSGGNINIWLRQNNFPPGYQILCANCNVAKGTGTACPGFDTRCRELREMRALQKR